MARSRQRGDRLDHKHRTTVVNPDLIKHRRAVFTCPAWHGTCSHHCFLRARCEQEPAKVMAFIERLDLETAAALERIAELYEGD
jgi:hypothetical protein